MPVSVPFWMSGQDPVVVAAVVVAAARAYGAGAGAHPLREVPHHS